MRFYLVKVVVGGRRGGGCVSGFEVGEHFVGCRWTCAVDGFQLAEMAATVWGSVKGRPFIRRRIWSAGLWLEMRLEI